ncbi:hypothetical protein A2962_04015 [Candidatus Woesebacteria bacterium RIFCSPLOWO2_01_FULL_39_61]|uniref:Four helix bundle protein n=1 Tax=Candidatus Woesebacteria bacterium RIFCSPHIGHO2_02_FULL_39_13 TaxID=1802505 RepID=A0A1F7YXX7_9BACT|nr:MAG: hypothetical protein A2692_02335 [Candidatus Woesebacteria bacterium RIFCSPHIGHO2_01_FULL_39_95]OGM32127.1 MAG: hypothetical protein A3D01_01945 [Candidatus Woesebacteria bacterium RIFCSPHIGHO2_02_FULL_39_13]OGM37234.1 MAG: hypothetical protein A3E13_03350 [Candidatus Woesebacteria bacterium RIFCSPHIGHO2_12_FULL_40_20]OGM65919.1 MAG: hypothetical protein A2962_04015 [Candidatus Woesebacteria bacterium RIFCSPLOWO2_01_FULL_39_61]OGM71441.1 MAG: hypothetical protein A3H19_04725 [Candidatus
MAKIERFTDLKAWQEGHQLVLMIYGVVKTFPKEENFILTTQILRAVISVTNNLAEGFGRRYYKEKIQFYSMARASLVEVCNQLMIARDVGYLNRKDFDFVWEQTDKVGRLITGLIKSIKK